MAFYVIQKFLEYQRNEDGSETSTAPEDVAPEDTYIYIQQDEKDPATTVLYLGTGEEQELDDDDPIANLEEAFERQATANNVEFGKLTPEVSKRLKSEYGINA